MSRRTTLKLALALALSTSSVARAQHGSGGGGGHGGGGHHHRGGVPLAAVGGGYADYWYRPYVVAGPGFYAVAPPMIALGPGGAFVPYGALPPPMPVRGPIVAAPPSPPAAAGQGAAQAAKPARADAARARQFLTFGDRLFRAGNIKKAEERYLQALKAATNQAAPYLRLALIALARGHYAEAANRLRDAETAEPGWIPSAPDVQSIYGEPAEFQRQLGQLESYVQSHPDDRDAWLVLGAQWFLSGRTGRAADVFLRLDDPHRQPDIALAAFRFASDRARPRENDLGQEGRSADAMPVQGP